MKNLYGPAHTEMCRYARLLINNIELYSLHKKVPTSCGIQITINRIHPNFLTEMWTFLNVGF